MPQLVFRAVINVHVSVPGEVNQEVVDAHRDALFDNFSVDDDLLPGGSTAELVVDEIACTSVL